MGRSSNIILGPMNHNGLTCDLYVRTELFQSIYENKEIVVVTSEFVGEQTLWSHHGNKTFTALLSRLANHCLGFYELESKIVEVNIHEFRLVFLKGC